MSNLKKLVIEEATKLKQHATKQELSNLSFARLNPDRACLCVYGLMTEYCTNPRAIELLNLCAKPFSESLGNVIPTRKRKFSDRSLVYIPVFSAIEFYISTEENNNKNLIKFLKGEIPTLTESML